MPAGIDTDIFKNDQRITAFRNSILYVGRISTVKNVDTLVEAGINLDKQHIPFVLDIYGSPDKTEGEYNKKLRILSTDLEKKNIVSYKGSVPNYKTPPIYNLHEVFVNLTPRGNYDKTILEAMACEKLVLVSSEAFRESLPEQFLFKERDSADLTEKLKGVFLLGEEEKRKYGKQMRDYVLKTHSLSLLAEKLAYYLS
jgi:glycosyltransferase involved in cell wall biosynthesis